MTPWRGQDAKGSALNHAARMILFLRIGVVAPTPMRKKGDGDVP